MDEQKYDAGWYPQSDGQLRWYDGHQWTQHFAPGSSASESASTSSIHTATVQGQAVAGRATETRSFAPADALWSATGRPVTGIGGGRFWLSHHYLFFEKGMLRTDSQQVPISAVVDVDVKQSLSQKARGLFTVVVHIQRSTRVELVSMDDIPDGRAAQQLINDTAHRARAIIQDRHQRQTVIYEGGLNNTVANFTPTPLSVTTQQSEDVMGMLQRLGQLRDAGVLTEEEFAAKKAEVLSRL